MEALPRLSARLAQSALAFLCVWNGIVRSQEALHLEAVLGGDPPMRTARGVAWWRSSALASANAGDEVRLRAGEWIEAPLALPCARASEALHAGFDLELEGVGVLRAELCDAEGVCDAVEIALDEDGARRRTPHTAPRAPRPRAQLRLEVQSGEIALRRIGMAIAWPAVDAAALRALVERELAFLGAALESARDVDGARATSFLTRRIDPASGDAIDRVPAGHHPYFDALLLLHEQSPQPWIETRLRAHLVDLLHHGWNARTGLPQLWDGERDLALEERALDPRGALGFAMDLARVLELTPPERTALHRRFARAARTLRAAQAPDGTWPAVLVPGSGQPAAEAPQIRALRSARLVAELEQACGAPPNAEAALACLAALELEWHWHGTPERPDPGFDDAFGLLGADAAALAHLTGAEPFARFVREASARYEELWLRSREAGGSNAPDQVRAMLLLLDEAADEETRARRARLALQSFRDLARTTQLADGRFADVTAVHFEPRLHLPVGDLQGVPFHLVRLGARLLQEHTLGEFAHGELRAVLAQALLALEPRRGRAGFGNGTAGFSDGGRLFQALAELRVALR
ncbi:MAG: hypothetical protein JNM84_21480 [Planctomycetes bacterium]|nr:hypothetical protein [Planctomycetota bacterium]